MDGGNIDANDLMSRIEAQMNAQMSEVFREQVTEKCFNVCADTSKKQMSSRESDCIDKYVLLFLSCTLSHFEIIQSQLFLTCFLTIASFYRCMHRFIDAMNVITETLASRSNRGM